MLPNPLTPPIAEYIEYDDLENEQAQSPLHDSLYATPSSLPSLGEGIADPWDENREYQTHDPPQDEEMSNDDSSEGVTASGHLLHLSLSASANPVEPLDSSYNDTYTDHDEMMADIYSFAESNSSPELEVSLGDQVTMLSTDIMQALPTVLQDVTAQLQHFQNGTEPALHFFPTNSTSLFSFTNVSTTGSQLFQGSADLSTAGGLGAESSVSAGVVPQQGGIVHTVELVVSSAPQSVHNEALPAQENQLWGGADVDEVDDQRNSSLGHFLESWGFLHADFPADKRSRGPSLTELHAQRYPVALPPVKKRDLSGDDCDIQRIDWTKLGVKRQEALQRRKQEYRNYTNLPMPDDWHSHLKHSQVPDTQNYFRFRKMDFSHDIALSHFQLRNLVSCASRDHVFYAGRTKVMHWNPLDGTQSPKSIAMNLRNPIALVPHGAPNGIQISTLTVGHDILVAGGFNGEYALLNLRAHRSTKHTEGIITTHDNSITNHLEVQLSRTSYSPQVAMASNDNGFRILDVATNKLVANHTFEYAINCSAISSDSRLRVMVGDRKEVLICRTDTGEVLQSLEGHTDYGFACDWADDGWTVATGNQDQQILIWDARQWTTASGRANPVAVVATEQAGIRKLKFSPLGSGKKVLVAAEPADIVNIIDAGTFDQKQKLHFFGEIGGFDFADGGRDLIVANCDSMRGGLMEFERCGLAQRSLHDLQAEKGRYDVDIDVTRYDWCMDEQALDSDKEGWGTIVSRRGKTTFLGSDMGHF